MNPNLLSYYQHLLLEQLGKRCLQSNISKLYRSAEWSEHALIGSMEEIIIDFAKHVKKVFKGKIPKGTLSIERETVRLEGWVENGYSIRVTWSY